MRCRHGELVAPDRQGAAKRGCPVRASLVRLIEVTPIIDIDRAADTVARPVGCDEKRRMRSDDPAPARVRRAEHIAVVAQPLIDLWMEHEFAETNARRLEIWPDA